MTSCDTPKALLTELKIARAYIKLCTFSEDSHQRSVSLASIGKHEIRIVVAPEDHPEGVPLFWLELFDNSTKTSVDSYLCYRIADAVPVFEHFRAQADESDMG